MYKRFLALCTTGMLVWWNTTYAETPAPLASCLNPETQQLQCDSKFAALQNQVAIAKTQYTRWVATPLNPKITATLKTRWTALQTAVQHYHAWPADTDVVSAGQNSYLGMQKQRVLDTVTLQTQWFAMAARSLTSWDADRAAMAKLSQQMQAAYTEKANSLKREGQPRQKLRQLAALQKAFQQTQATFLQGLDLKRPVTLAPDLSRMQMYIRLIQTL